MSDHDALHPALADARQLLIDRGDELGVDLLECPRCDGDMMIRQTQIDTEPCRNDIRVKCPWDHGGCGWWTRHGVGITAETFREEMERREHKLVDAVTTAPPTEDAEENVEERLAALGYLDHTSDQTKGGT